MQQENRQKQKVICVHCRDEVKPEDNKVSVFLVGLLHTLCWSEWDEDAFFERELVKF